MKFIKNVPNIKILQNNQYILEIKSVQTFREIQDKVILQCAEEIPMFKRGYICDMECHFQLIDSICQENDGERIDVIKDLVLVYINKDINFDYMPQFEYVFYK